MSDKTTTKSQTEKSNWQDAVPAAEQEMGIMKLLHSMQEMLGNESMLNGILQGFSDIKDGKSPSFSKDDWKNIKSVDNSALAMPIPTQKISEQEKIR